MVGKTWRVLIYMLMSCLFTLASEDFDKFLSSPYRPRFSNLAISYARCFSEGARTNIELRKIRASFHIGSLLF
jgi:hypothetical protein